MAAKKAAMKAMSKNGKKEMKAMSGENGKKAMKAMKAMTEKGKQKAEKELAAAQALKNAGSDALKEISARHAAEMKAIRETK